MLRSLLNSPTKTIASAAFLISTTTLLSRCVGIIRDRIFAHYFGIGPIVDAYYAAFKVPDFVYNLLIVGALSTGFIPIFTSLYNRENPTKAWRLSSAILNLAGCILAITSLVGSLSAPLIAHIIAPGFDHETLKLTISFTRIIFLSPLLLGISMVLGGILQSLRHFVTYSFAPILYNVGIIIGSTVLYPLIGPTGIAWGVVLGAALHTAVQWYGAHTAGFRWSPIFSIRDTMVRTIGRLMIPRTLGLALTHINTVIMSVFASTLTTGSVAAFNLANNIQGVPTGIIGIPFALAVFPLLAEAYNKREHHDYSKLVSDTVRTIIFLIVPISTLFLMLRAQIVRVLYGTGAFDWRATITTSDALAFFALGLVAQSLIPVLARAFYARSDTKTPFYSSIIAEACTLLFAIAFIRPEFGFQHAVPGLSGVAALACASSLGVTLNAILLYVQLKKHIDTNEHQKLMYLLIKTVIAAIGMAIVIQLLKEPLANFTTTTSGIGIFLQGCIAGLAGSMVYIGLSTVLRITELQNILYSLKRRFLKPDVVPGAIDDGSTV